MDLNFNGIFAYSTTSTNDAAYIIGGGYWKMSQIIVEFKNDRWTRLRQAFQNMIKSYHPIGTVNFSTTGKPL